VFFPYVDLRHLCSGSGADETSGSVRGCERVEKVFVKKKSSRCKIEGEEDDDKSGKHNTAMLSPDLDVVPLSAPHHAQ
jgi:hypothetical protein